MEILHRGFDKLEVSFSGAVPTSIRRALHEAKERAIESGEAEYISLRGVPCWVKDKGASGGYEFVIDTGANGEMWAFKNSDDPMEWNFRAVVSSTRCALDGWEGVRDRLRGQLKAWGIMRTTGMREASIARIDYAVDFVSDGFELDPSRLVCHWKADIAEHDSTALDVHWKNRKVSSLTIGRMPGRQVIAYDKTRETRATGKETSWSEIWGFCPLPNTTVWRIEVRAGKQALTRAKVRTFEDAERLLGSLFQEALEKIRLVKSADVANITRDAMTVPEWSAVARVVSECIDGATGEIDRERVVEGQKADIAKVYRQQIIGCMVAYGHTIGRTVSDFVAEMPGEIAADLDMMFSRDKTALKDKFRRAKARLKFMDEPLDHPSNKGDFSYGSFRQGGEIVTYDFRPQFAGSGR